MSYTRSPSEQGNSYSSRIAAQQASRTQSEKSGGLRSPVSEGHAEADQEQFEKLFNDLKRGPSDLEKLNGKAGSSSLTERSAADGSTAMESAGSKGDGADMLLRDEYTGAESRSTLDDLVDEFHQGDDKSNEGGHVNELSMFMDATSFAASIEAHSETRDIAAGTQPVNEAATRIIDEMQSRARRNESRRWQFTLPGLLGGQVTVSVERTGDQSWVVELTTPDDCSDEDRLALAHRLGERLDDVTVTTAESRS